MAERKTFAIQGFGSTFSTVVDSNLSIRQVREYDETYAPLIELSDGGSAAGFLIEIACFEVDMYADPLNMAIAIANIWGGNQIDFDRENLSPGRASVTYREGDQNNRNVRLHIFKNVNHFVMFSTTYGQDQAQIDRYAEYEKNLIHHFRFENQRDNASQLGAIQLDSRSRILLPSDWKYRDDSDYIRQNFDPKGTVTRAYYFEHKERSAGSLPAIFLAHYQDRIEDAGYLLETYKERIALSFSNEPAVIFDKTDIVTRKDDNGKIILQSLVIKLRDPGNQSLPMEVRATLFENSPTDGCYIIYITGATVTDARIREVRDFNQVNGWMVIDVMGSSMERLLFNTLNKN